MSDYFFKAFYDNVKGPNWPPCENMLEFSKLPLWIKDECMNQHCLDQRLSELEDKNYWYRQLSHSVVYRKDHVVYVPTYKCASTYYSNLVLAQGWVKENIWDLDLKQIKAFGLMLHPLTRRLKGMIEVISQSFNNDHVKARDFLSNENNRHFLNQISIMDAHTMPYSFLFGSKLHQISWIPMELYSDDDIKSSIIAFCKQHGVDITIPREVGRSDNSSDDKVRLYEILKDSFLSEFDAEGDLYLMFAEDLRFFHDLLKKCCKDD